MRFSQRFLRELPDRKYFFCMIFTLALVPHLQGFEYAGSAACSACHLEIYEAWKKTPHSRMTRTPEQVSYFEDIPAEGFEVDKSKIKFVLGTHNVHRFVGESSGTLVILPRIFAIADRKWLKTRDYGWKKRFWHQQCIGCHSTGYSPQTETYVELGIGCEGCHGPALNHVRTQSPEFVVNPAKLPDDRREMVCASCHTSGVDVSGEYSFPVGFKPGDDLTRFYFGLTPKPGQDPSNFLGDETFEDRLRQWEFLKSRLFLAKGLTCDYCQNFRDYKTSSGSDFVTHEEYCLTCHTDRTDHPRKNPGTGCIGCHIPLRNAAGKKYSIHDHKFCFESPPPQN